jgi:ribosomal protein S18 acetylase RimI-like enzyme
MTFKVRRLAAGDDDKLIELVAARKSARVTSDYAKKLLANEANYLVVAEDCVGEILGFVWAYRLDRIDQRNPQLFVYEVDVSERHRKHGIGTALMLHVREMVREQRLMEAFVLTAATNSASIRL